MARTTEEILAQYGLDKNGRLKKSGNTGNQAGAAAKPVTNAAAGTARSSEDILAKYGLDANGKRLDSPNRYISPASAIPQTSGVTMPGVGGQAGSAGSPVPAVLANGAGASYKPVSRLIEESNAAIRYNQAKQRVEQDRRSANDIYSGDFAAREAERQRREKNEADLRASEQLLDRLGIRGEPESARNTRQQLEAVTQQLQDTRSAIGKVAGRSGYEEHREFDRLTGQAQELESQRRALVSELKQNGGKLTAREKLEELKTGGADFIDSLLSGGDQAWGGIYGLLAMADEATGSERSPFRDTAGYHNEKAAETLQRTTEGRGFAGTQAMKAGQAAGNMLAGYSLSGLAAGSGAAAGARYFTGWTNKVANAGAKIGNELISNATNAAISLGSAGHTYLDATERGADKQRAMANAVGSGLLEYFSNKLFTGTPLEDTGEKGYVTKLIEYTAGKLGKSEALSRFLSSVPGKALNYAFDKAGEGLEEVVTAIGDPLIERITWNPDADYATADEIVDAFVGGVALSSLMSGGEALLENTARAGAKLLGSGEDTTQTGAERNAAPSPGSVAQPEAVRAGNETHGTSDGAEAQISPQSAETIRGTTETPPLPMPGAEAAQQSGAESGAPLSGAAEARVEGVQAGNETRGANGGAEAQKTGNLRAADMSAANEATQRAAQAMDELGTHPSAAPAGLASDSLEAYGTSNAARQAEFRRAEQIARRFGADLEVEELDDGVDGRYQDGRITISPNAKNPVMTVLVHELTHHMESSSQYAAFSDAVLGYVADEMGVDIGTMKRAIQQEYGRSGYALDDAGAEREIVAKFAESKLFQDEEAVNRLARTNRGIFETVRQWISDIIVRLRGTAEERFLRNAERMYERALESVGDVAQTNGGAAQYSMGDLDLSRSYVNYADQQERDSRMQQAMNRAIAADNVVELNADDLDMQLQKTNWNDRSEARKYLKKLVTDVMGDSVYFKIGDGTLEAYVTGTARSHFAGYPTVEKAASMQKFNELVQSATYAYSSEHDIHSGEGRRVEANVWDSFVVPVRVRDEVVPFLFSVRSIDDDFRAQIYSMNIKTEAPSGEDTSANTATASRGYGYRDEPLGRTPSYGGFSTEEGTASHGYASQEALQSRTPNYGRFSPSETYDSTESTEVNGEIEDEYDRYRLRRADEDGAQRSYGSGFDQLASEARYTAEELGAEAESVEARKGDKKTGKRENRPSRSKAHLRHELTSVFSVLAGSRATFTERINSVADEMLRTGRVSAENREAMIRALYDAGVAFQEADPSYQAARTALRGRRIYVNESIRADLGDDWNSLRARAMGNGIYFVTDPSKGIGVDVVADELAGVAGNNVVDTDADGATQLMQMVEAAERGRGETISLADEADQLAQQYGEEVREDQISNLERQFDEAVRRFAEKAKLEVELKDYADQRVEQKYQKDKEYWQGRLKAEREAKWERVEKEKDLWRELFRKKDDARKQRDAAAQTLRNLKRLRRRIGQNDTRLAAAMERLTPEEQAAAQEALGTLADHAQRLTKHAQKEMELNSAWYDEMVKNDPNYIPDKKTLALLERMDQTYLSEKTPEELMHFHYALQKLEKHLADIHKEIGKERGEEFGALYRAVTEEIEKSGGRGKPAGKISFATSRFFNEEQLTPMNYIEMLGGWDPNNNWTQAVARQLESGERAKKQFIVEANDMVKDFRENHADWIARSDGQGKDAIWYDIEVPALLEYGEGHKPIFSDETVKVYLTPSMKVELARGIRNDDNLRHAEVGITFPDRELYAKGLRKQAYERGTTIKLAPETMKKVFAYDTLTAEEKELFNLMDKFFDGKAKEAINETSQQLDGVDRALTNHYSKIYTNQNYTKTDATKTDESLFGMGSLQQRVEYAKNPMYAMSVWEAFDDTVDTVAKYHGLAIPTRNVNMLLNWTEWGGNMNPEDPNRQVKSATGSLKDTISHKWGGEAKEYLENLLVDLQNPKVRDKSFVDMLAGKALNNYVTATFGMNPGIVIKQFSSFPSAMAVLGADTMPTPAQIARTDTELIRKYTPELEYRSMGYATPELAELKNNPNWTQRNKVTRFLFGGAIQGMDRFTVKAMWPWAENYVKKNYSDLTPGSEEFYRKTAEVYNDAVSQTQPMYDVMHRAKIMQNANDLTRAFTMFKTVPMQQQNMLRKALGEAVAAKDGSKTAKKQAAKNLARTVGSLVFANLLFEAIEFGNQALKNAAKNYRDEDDELTALSAGSAIVKSMLKDMAGMFIGGDELTDLVAGITGSSRYYDMESPGLTQINDIGSAIVNATNSIGKLCTDVADIKDNDASVKQYVRDNGGDLLGSFKDLAETLSVYLAGVPVPNTEKYLLGVLRAVSPKVEQEYKALFDTTTKSDLSGLSGDALQVRVDDLIDSRVKGVGQEAKRELARLYESTGVEVIPTDIPTSVTIDGEQKALTAAQQQRYRNTYADTLERMLDGMVTSEGYQALTDEQRACAITSLYGYAKALARSEATDTELPASAEKVKTAGEMGLDASKYFLISAQLGEYDELDGDERGQARVEALRDMDLTGAEKSAAYYAIFAGDKEKTLLDDAPGLSVGEVADVLLGLRGDGYLKGDERTKAQRQTLLDASLPDRLKRDIYRTMISDKHEEVIDELARSGIGFDQWLTFERDTAGLSSTKDENGKDVKGQTRQDKVWRVIDGYKLSRAQKNAMHFAAGYKESSLKNAPWN